MNLHLLQPEVREYLIQHINDNALDFILKSHPFDQITNQQLTQQLVGYQKAKLKFKHLLHATQIVYPHKQYLEQTSSWHTAVYKSSLVSGNSMIDLTGGFGIDASAFITTFKQVTHIEHNPELQAMACQSFKAQQLPINSYCTDAITYLTTTTTNYDLIYLDPSRKTAAHHKAIMLQDYEPNVIDHLALLLKKANRVMIKTSPMLDINAGLSQLNNVSKLHIVAVKNEVKELLWILDHTPNDQPITVTCVNLLTDQPAFTYTRQSTSNLSYHQPLTYLYEPNAAIMKSQAFDDVCRQYQLYKIDQHAHLFTSDQLINFPGRIFKIQTVTDYKPKVIKRLYNNSRRAVVVRRFRESVQHIRNKYKIKEHDTDYLFFTSTQNQSVVIAAQKI